MSGLGAVRKALTFLLLALAFALSARAQQRIVAPTLGSACVCSALGAPPTRRGAPATVIDRHYDRRRADLKVKSTFYADLTGTDSETSQAPS